ncbi:hypothetical protein NDU88_005844 [Pleurodeles waltl]|uniref:Uncharacterized protein n=1 Tax=Pleurodeles waltl TaxID=8319 RepID=A0AAV7QLV3_PLEWA|nr:hypothetical protein NDU88_005844 [Pleurodeles waltl]
MNESSSGTGSNSEAASEVFSRPVVPVVTTPLEEKERTSEPRKSEGRILEDPLAAAVAEKQSREYGGWEGARLQEGKEHQSHDGGKEALLKEIMERKANLAAIIEVRIKASESAEKLLAWKIKSDLTRNEVRAKM